MASSPRFTARRSETVRPGARSAQDQLPPRHPPLSGRAAGAQVRGARRARDRTALRSRRLPDRGGHQRPHLGHRGHGTHGADRPCRAAEPRPCRVPRRRLLRQRHTDGAVRPAVPRLLHPGGHRYRARRRSHRDPRPPAPRHLPRDRHPRSLRPDRGHHRARRAVDRRRGRPGGAHDHHRGSGGGPLRLARSLLLALSRGRAARDPRLPERPARVAGTGPSSRSAIRKSRRRRWG